MDNTTSIALSRLIAQQRAIDVTASNIANVSTPGYRAERVQFSDWLVKEPTLAEPPGSRTLSYTQDRATWRDMTPGPLTHTGNPLDLAIASPDAWFTVLGSNGPRLTRAGHFSLSSTGDVVDTDGNALLDTGGQKITLGVGDTKISVAGDGTISTQNGQIAKIGLVKPDTTAGMTGEGSRLYDLPPGDQTQQTTTGGIVQGAVEDSNVQPITELSGMLNTMREFQFTTQFVQGEADRQQSAIDKILPQRS